MNASIILGRAGAIALVALCAACSTWNRMDSTDKGTAIGATSGAVAGAAVGGPVGAAVGAGVGGIVGHEGAKPGPAAGAGTAANAHDSTFVRSVQQALADKSFNPGPVDGQWGPGTESALRDFQQARGLAQTGRADGATLAALGLSRDAAATTAPRTSSTTPPSSTAAAPR